jgi:DNA adenine methylase
MSFGGQFDSSWGNVVTYSARGMAGTCSAVRSAIDRLPAVHERLQRVQIENADALTVIERYAVQGAFCYCDPPYVADTRQAGGYAHEMTDEEHEALVALLLECPAQVMVSGYAHPIYAALDEAGWNRTEFATVCHAAGRTRTSGLQGEGAAMEHQARTEVVWRNYERRDVTLTLDV